MQAGAVLFFSFFDRQNSPAKASQLDQFLLDRLQPFKSLAVSDLRFGGKAALTSGPSILLIERLKLRDLSAEACNLIAKHFEVIHSS
jgi:hypothetical protein